MDDVLAGVFATLWFSWVAVPFALIPVGIVAMVARSEDSRWRIPVKDGPDRKIHYVLLGLAGGILGEFTATSSLFLASWWDCRIGDPVCHDGQSGMLLIVTIPVLSFFGSVISLLWTWISLGVAPSKPWASVFLYDGPNRQLNRILAVAIPIMFWSLSTLVITHMTP